MVKNWARHLGYTIPHRSEHNVCKKREIIVELSRVCHFQPFESFHGICQQALYSTTIGRRCSCEPVTPYSGTELRTGSSSCCHDPGTSRCVNDRLEKPLCFGQARLAAKVLVALSCIDDWCRHDQVDLLATTLLAHRNRATLGTFGNLKPPPLIVGR